MKERLPDRISYLKKICDESVLGEVVTGAMIQIHKMFDDDDTITTTTTATRREVWSDEAQDRLRHPRYVCRIAASEAQAPRLPHLRGVLCIPNLLTAKSTLPL